MDDEDSNNDAINLILEGRKNLDIQKEKSAEKTSNNSSKYISNNSTPSITRGEEMDDNLAKIVARRSQGVNISDGDMFMGHRNDEVVIDFGPEDNGLPGAYSGAPGTDYGRIAKTPLPQQLLGDATKNQPAEDDKEIDNPPGETEPAQGWSFQDADQVESARRKKWRRMLVTLIGFVLLLLAIILPTVLLLGGKDGEEERLDTLDGPPAEETMLVPNLTQSTIEALEDPDSYQHRAYEWVQGDPIWETYDPWRKQQRFAMACLFYSIILPSRFASISLADTQIFGKWMKYHFNECQWQQYLPSGSCGNHGKIVTLDFSIAHSLKGFIPPEVAFLTNPETIQFLPTGDAVNLRINNDLETLLPLDQTNFLPALKSLIIFDCSLPGSLPSTLGLLTTLTSLDLNQNALTSTIPSELGLLTQLKTLILSWNELSGTIPKEIGELPLLTDFGVDNNTLMIEPLLPDGFCLENRATQMGLLSTNWCWSVGECCS